MAAAVLADAIAAHQAGRLDQAEKLYRAFLAQEPDHADANALLGVVVGARGDYAEAMDLAEKAVALDPASGLLRFHQGTILMAALRLDEAIAALHRSLMLSPDVAQTHFNLANGLRAQGEWDEAIAHYHQALAIDPHYAPAANNLSLSLVHNEKYQQALVFARRAVETDPAFGDGWVTLCNVAEKLKDYPLALDAGRRATELMPQSPYAWFGYGLALNRLNRDDEAVACYRRSLELRPGNVDTIDNLGQSYLSLGRLDEAEQVFRQAIDAAGETIENEQGRAVEESEYGKRHWHLALLELLQGQYKQGFARYRARTKAIPELKRPTFPWPLWRGEDLRGKTLLVCDEQGYGDTLMLARFLPLLRAQGARVIFSVHKALAPLFRGWNGADAVVEHNGQIPPSDYYCASFDVLHWLGVTLQNLPHSVPYLPVLPPDAATLLPKDGRKKIGVVWGGSPLHLNDEKRSVPLALFADVLNVQGVTFYSFNRDLKKGDADILPHCPVENLIPRLNNFADAARLVGQMDLIIACDTATAHLAGGLGIPVWVMLPFAPDWRWLTGRSDSPWYPTMHLFRQPKPGDWASVVDAVKAALVEDIF